MSYQSYGEMTIEELRPIAEAGDLEAIFEIASRYTEGLNGTEKDWKEAAYWLRKGAEMGDDYCQHWLGNLYAAGEGVPLDKAEAAKWWRMAADQDEQWSQCYLGELYLKGDGVPQDKAEAVRLFRAATSDDAWIAFFNLGLCYFNGDGVEKDEAEGVMWIQEGAWGGEEKAIDWLNEAAEKGYEPAKKALEEIEDEDFYHKRLVFRDYQQEAEEGDGEAQYNLGNCYLNGEGCTQDRAKAVAWFRKAAEQGNEDAKAALAELEQEKEQ